MTSPRASAPSEDTMEGRSLGSGVGARGGDSPSSGTGPKDWHQPLVGRETSQEPTGDACAPTTLPSERPAASAPQVEERDFGDGRGPYLIVPERLVQVEGIDYVRCPLHGLIQLDHNCAESPHDHWCRATAHPRIPADAGPDDLDDQGTSHRDWSMHQSIQLKEKRDLLASIAAMHTQGDADGHGGTDGFCCECDFQWPCRTAHLANGWGDREDCEAEGWCSHASVKVTRLDD